MSTLMAIIQQLATIISNTISPVGSGFFVLNLTKCTNSQIRAGGVKLDMSPTKSIRQK
jgi:hypothetical protein